MTLCSVQSVRCRAGELGVLIFFVLSGYLITTLALREEDKYGSLSLSALRAKGITSPWSVMVSRFTLS